jgi:hypothetical protein
LVIGVVDILNAVPDLTEVARHTQGRCSGTGSAGVSLVVLDLKVGSQREAGVWFGLVWFGLVWFGLVGFSFN